MKMEPGNWYFAVDCKTCGAKMALFLDASGGKTFLDGDPLEVKYKTDCRTCGKWDTYPLIEVHHFYAKKKGE